MPTTSIHTLISNGERATLECKKAQRNIPNSIWETYSAFANTYGGTILLGIEENRQEQESSVQSSVQIIEIIKNSPTITAREISKTLDLSCRNVEKQIKKLREQGILRRIGPNKGGHWEVVEHH